MKNIFMLLFLSLVTVLSASASGSGNSELACAKITIKNIHHTKGTLWLTFYENENSFPNWGEQDYSKPIVGLQDSTEEVAVCGIKTGWYAVAVFQDVDDDNMLNVDVVGNPKEPYGFSNNARYKGIAPSFKICKVYFEAGKPLDIDISLVNP